MLLQITVRLIQGLQSGFRVVSSMEGDKYVFKPLI